MATTSTPRPDQRPPQGEQLTYTVFDEIGLWCTYVADEDGIELRHVWINGQWLNAFQLFGNAQYDAWCNAVECDLVGDAEALAAEVLAELPRLDAAVARARAAA